MYEYNLFEPLLLCSRHEWDYFVGCVYSALYKLFQNNSIGTLQANLFNVTFVHEHWNSRIIAFRIGKRIRI